MISEEFRERLRNGKYSKWASELTVDQLRAVIWAVGEYGGRAKLPLEVLHQHSPKDCVSHARALLALEVLSDFTRGRFIDFDQYCLKVYEAVANVGVASKLRHSAEEDASDE